MLEISEERKRYCEKWDKYFETYRDQELEAKINNNEIDVDVYIPSAFDKCKNSFSHKYKNTQTKYDFDQLYGRTFLRYLFEHGFKYLFIEQNSLLYQKCKKLKNHIIYSPYKNFCEYKKIFILTKNNHLYYIVGKAYYKEIEETLFEYVGKIGEKNNIQITIFDFIKE